MILHLCKSPGPQFTPAMVFTQTSCPTQPPTSPYPLPKPDPVPCPRCCLWSSWITLRTNPATSNCPGTSIPHTQGYELYCFLPDFISNHCPGHVEVLTCTAPVSCARLSILPQLLSSTPATHCDALGQLLCNPSTHSPEETTSTSTKSLFSHHQGYFIIYSSY